MGGDRLFDASDLKLEHVKTPTTSGEDYIKDIVNPSALYTHEKILEWYEPEGELVAAIRDILESRDEKLTIVVFAATWCPDSTQIVPRLIKVGQAIDSQCFSLQFLPPVLMDFKKNREGHQFPWAVPPSPDEILDSRFFFSRVPTLYLFLKDGNCIGRIVEDVAHAGNIEGEILYFLKS
ncbi:MAG: thioredoxin family protein [Promethearchaeota archaeon]